MQKVTTDTRTCEIARGRISCLAIWVVTCCYMPFALSIPFVCRCINFALAIREQVRAVLPPHGAATWRTGPNITSSVV